jgi:hypothetical protein
VKINPRLRIETLLVAARRVFGKERDPAIVHALAAESGLDIHNVMLALDHVLELHPTDAQLDAMVSRAPERTAVLVVLAGNVFVAPFRAIAWALAQSDTVIVRPSRRAVTFPKALIDAVPALEIQLSPILPDDIPNAIAALPDGAAVHAYGSQATLDAIAPHATIAELHGPGFGAMVAHDDEYIEAASAIAEDIAVFDQGGCLSPRVAFVIGDASRVAEALHGALGNIGESIPRRTLEPAETSAMMRSRDAALYAGRVLEGSEHLVLQLPEAALAPAGRALVVVSVKDIDEAIRKLKTLDELAIIGTTFDVRAQFPRLRIAPLGRMQKPPLDGPVDLRVL